MCTVFVKNTTKGMVAARNHSWTQPGGNVHFIPPKRIYGKISNAMYLMDQWGQAVSYTHLTLPTILRV